MKATKPFHQIGTVTDQVRVELSFQILGLFSEGQYSSPNKAVEELVSNAFDADATRVDLLVSDDLAGPDSSVAVVDNGVGMDPEGLKVHWIVGASAKTKDRNTPLGRTTIGKFGIGKLAAYVLGNRLTHISRVGDKYYSTTMDFTATPQTVSLPEPAPLPETAPVVGAGQSPTEQRGVLLDIRSMTEVEALVALGPWLKAPSRRSLPALFGDGSSNHWTVAIISDLKPMAQDLQEGRLRWILSTAMPLRDDFALYYNAKPVAAAKLGKPQVGRWVLAKDIKTLPDKDLRDLRPKKSSAGAWAYNDKLLGQISGYLEVFEDPIDTGKSGLIGRSNGFFVYVHGRLINVDDAGFGIDRNSLRHGTFSRFRLIIHIDRLDNELRSSREALRDSPSVRRSKAILLGIFNFARTKLDAYLTDEAKVASTRGRLADSPASLGQRPLIGLIVDSYRSREPMRYTELDVGAFDSSDALVAFLEKRLADGSSLVTNVAYADMGVTRPLVTFDVDSGVLSINLEHPFVAYFADDFGRKDRNMALQLVALSEVVLEANMHRSGISRNDRLRLLDDRDDLLRWLARSNGQQNSLTVAQDLLNAESSKQGLEDAVVAAFNQLGFDAVPKGGGNNPDGVAEAHLAGAGGAPRSYRVSLEAKSKEAVGAKVSKSGVEVATIARHRDDNGCQHAIVVGPDFSTRLGENGALVTELRSDREHSKADKEHREDRTITVVRLKDVAKLVRFAPVKRISLLKLRELFECVTPNECAAWIEATVTMEVPQAKYREILEVVWSEQTKDKSYSVTYDALRRLLREQRGITIADPDLRNECLAIERMAPNLFWAREESVELEMAPDRVLATIVGYVDEVRERDGVQGV